ncbi:MAG: CYTH domain-containing protein [Patescibacteria group bacterium]|jgi:predicted adenylyl cyclase CyaB
MKNIEVEVRGMLPKEKVERLKTLFAKDGRLKESKKRLLIDYSSFIPGQELGDRDRDIRLRTTNGQPEIIVKLGNWGVDERREEISIKTEEGSFEELVKAFAAMNMRKGMMAIRESEVYDYKGIEFAIVTVPNHSYYFEAEKMSTEENSKQAYQEILEVCKDLGLEPFDQKGFLDYIDLLNKEANQVFDFEKYTPGYFDKFLI